MADDVLTASMLAASVVRSPLDARVWCAVLPDTDVHTGTLHASTSARRCKEYAATQVLGDLDPYTDAEWVRTDPDTWDLYLTKQEARRG